MKCSHRQGLDLLVSAVGEACVQKRGHNTWAPAGLDPGGRILEELQGSAPYQTKPGAEALPPPLLQTPL